MEPELGNLQANGKVRPVPKRPAAEMFGRATPFSDAQPRTFADFPGAVVYSPVGYIPQIVAIWTAAAVGGSVEAAVGLGRILNAALTLSLFLLAFRIMPSGRLFLLLLALMPMTAAMAASLGHPRVTGSPVCHLCHLPSPLVPPPRRGHMYSTGRSHRNEPPPRALLRPTGGRRVNQ